MLGRGANSQPETLLVHFSAQLFDKCALRIDVVADDLFKVLRCLRFVGVGVLRRSGGLFNHVSHHCQFSREYRCSSTEWVPN